MLIVRDICFVVSNSCIAGYQWLCRLMMEVSRVQGREYRPSLYVFHNLSSERQLGIIEPRQKDRQTIEESIMMWTNHCRTALESVWLPDNVTVYLLFQSILLE